MASRRVLVSSTTTDALQNELIKDVDAPSYVNLFATAVDVDDTIGLSLDKTEIMAPGTANVSAAASGMVDTGRDQLLFNSVVGLGRLRMPVVVTTSLIYLLSVEPIL
jgi:hypothetical protein